MLGLEWTMIKLGIKIAAVIVLLLVSLTMCSILAHAGDMVVGDSIGIGTGHALGVSTYGRTGAGSCEIVRRVPQATYDHAVISAGINDGGACVGAVRAAVHAQSVVWILPAPINSGRAAVLAAVLLGDKTVSYACAGGCTKSNFHPASYAVVASAVRAAWSGTWVSKARPSGTTSAISTPTPPVTPTWINRWLPRFGR